MSDETKNAESNPAEIPSGGLATVWRIPGPIPNEGREPEVPSRMPEFWVREHRVPSQLSRPQVRDRPYVLRGRDHETAFMAKQVHGMPKPVQLIYGPPGAGKTSLLHNIARYAAAQGYRVIKLDHCAFNSHIELADAFRGIPDAVDRIPAAATVPEWEVSDGNVAIARRGASVATTYTHEMNQATRQWIDAIRTESANPAHRGLLVLLDEVQLLGDHAEGSDNYERVKTFLQFMHSEVLCEANRPGARAILICAGMPNANDTLIHYGLTRAEGEGILRLGPIGDDATRQIILDHMLAETGKGRPLPQLPEVAVQRMIEMCGGFAHHISHAAQNSQNQAMEALLDGRVELTEDDLAVIFRKMRDAQIGYCQGRVRDLTARPITRPVRIIAQATIDWGERLPAEALENLIQLIMQQGAVNSEDLLRDVIANGILEKRNRPSGFPTAVVDDEENEHYVFPIHSMLTWLLSGLERADQIADTKGPNQRLIDAATRPEAKQSRVPAWGWDYGRRLPRLEPMPPDEPWQPVDAELPQVGVSLLAPRAAGRAVSANRRETPPPT